MSKRTPPYLHEKGQSVTETILMLPLYFALVFGMLQIGLLGTAVVTATYSAGSIARKAALQDVHTFNASDFQQRLKDLLFANMQYEGLSGHIDNSKPVATLTVNTCLKVNAFPFVGVIMKAALRGGAVGTADVASCNDNLGFVSYVHEVPYFFVAHGNAKVRLNYQP